MVLVAVITGFAVGFAVWYAASRWIAQSLVWAESRYPEFVGTKRLRVAEGIACGVVFFACLGLAFWIAWLVWLQMK